VPKSHSAKNIMQITSTKFHRNSSSNFAAEILKMTDGCDLHSLSSISMFCLNKTSLTVFWSATLNSSRYSENLIKKLNMSWITEDQETSVVLAITWLTCLSKECREPAWFNWRPLDQIRHETACNQIREIKCQFFLLVIASSFIWFTLKD
jgi:hypothetical protein